MPEPGAGRLALLEAHLNVHKFHVGPLFVAVLILTGCSEGKKEKAVYKVHGRLTYNGQPMSKASISFYPVDPNDRSTPAHATVDDDGRFDMHTYRDGDGVPAGEHIVVIHWPGPRPKKDKDKGDPDEPEGTSVAPDRLKGEYNLAKSKLRFTVREQDNTADLKLP